MIHPAYAGTTSSPDETAGTLFRPVHARRLGPLMRSKMVGGLVAMAILAEAIAAGAAYAIGQPDAVDVNEIIVRPTQQPL